MAITIPAVIAERITNPISPPPDVGNTEERPEKATMVRTTIRR